MFLATEISDHPEIFPLPGLFAAPERPGGKTLHREVRPTGETRPGFFLCAPGRAHSLGGVNPLWTLMTGTISRTARVSSARGNLKEAVSKVLAR